MRKLPRKGVGALIAAAAVVIPCATASIHAAITYLRPERHPIGVPYQMRGAFDPAALLRR